MDMNRCGVIITPSVHFVYLNRDRMTINDVSVSNPFSDDGCFNGSC
jgi:hypothetical protein